ncbi:MAG: prepilin peptidase [Bacilli bacterium]
MGVFIFILGLLLGSFYNVVGITLLRKESILFPRSHCLKCNHTLVWYENIPVISYLFLRGKCKNCHQKISFMYPSMELLTGILFLISYNLFGIGYDFYLAIILSSLVVLILITDTKHMIILDEMLVASGVLILLVNIIYKGLIYSLQSLGNGLVIFLMMYLLMLLGNFLFKKESLGGGDIKLSFIAGMVLGIPIGIFYIIIAAFLAFPYAVYISIKNSDGTLPFGPFLATSLFLCFCSWNLLFEFINTLFNKI